MISEKIVYIVGPTASGKTTLSLHLAKAFNGEIINTDAFAFYKDTAVLTAKPTKEQQLVPHHLIDFLELGDTSYTIFDFQKAFLNAIQEINLRGKLVIVVGGSNLYVEASLYPVSVEQNKSEERELVSRMSLNEFWTFLQNKQDSTALSIHPKDSRRLKVAFDNFLAESRVKFDTSREIFSDILFLSLECDSPALVKELIEKRCCSMFFEEKGLEELIHVLDYFSNQEEVIAGEKPRGVLSAIGYIEMLSFYHYLKKRNNVQVADLKSFLSKDKEAAEIFANCFEKLKQATLKLHKAQKKWIKNRLMSRFESKWKVLSITADDVKNSLKGLKQSALKEVKDFLSQSPPKVSEKVTRNQSKLWTCGICFVTCSISSQTLHLKSKGHKANVRKLKK